MDNLGQRWIGFRIIGRLGLPAPAGVIVGECFSDWCGDYPKDALSDPTGPTEGGNRGPWRQLGRAGLELSFGFPGRVAPYPTCRIVSESNAQHQRFAGIFELGER